METETKTAAVPLGCGATVTHSDAHVVWLEEESQSGHPGAFALARTELENLVQFAYDQFGILAEPSYAAEAERAELPDVAGMIRGHVAAAQMQQVLNSTVTP